METFTVLCLDHDRTEYLGVFTDLKVSKKAAEAYRKKSKEAYKHSKMSIEIVKSLLNGIILSWFIDSEEDKVPSEYLPLYQQVVWSKD